MRRRFGTAMIATLAGVVLAGACATEPGAGDGQSLPSGEPDASHPDGAGGAGGGSFGIPDAATPVDASFDRSDAGEPGDRDSALPDGYPPAKCIPPCIWAALLSCRVPELLERSCIWEASARTPPDLGPPPLGTACSTQSTVRLERRSEAMQGPPGTRDGVVFEYSVDGLVCLRAEEPPTSYPNARTRVYRDATGTVIAVDDISGLARNNALQPTVYCHPGTPDEVPYPYAHDGFGPPELDPTTDPDCRAWLPYVEHQWAANFMLDAPSACAPGICSPAPAVFPGDSGVADTGVPDAGASDTGRPEAGPVDAARPDAK